MEANPVVDASADPGTVRMSFGGQCRVEANPLVDTNVVWRPRLDTKPVCRLEAKTECRLQTLWDVEKRLSTSLEPGEEISQ